MSARNKATPTPGRGRLAAALALLTMLSGCAVGPDFLRPEAPPVQHYSTGADPTLTTSAAGAAQRFAPGAAVAADWWRLFNSDKLGAIITAAIAANPSLEAAQQSLRQSQDNLRAGYGIFFPWLGADFGASREKFSPLSFGSAQPGTIFSLFTLSGTISYPLDIFGGERRAVEGLAAQVDVQGATEQATFLTLSANIVDTVIAKAAYHAEIEATQQLIVLQRQQVALAEIQARAGTVPYSNVLSLESQLASFEATIPQLRQKLTQSDDLLATLAGHTPAEWTPPEMSLAELTLPADLPVSLPSDLVRQRPDILAAEATAHAASANIGVATAAMLPSVTLSGAYGNNSLAVDRLFSSAGHFWSFGGDVTAPLFEGGKLWFQRKAAIDAYRQAMAAYRQTVLSAFAQVADTLGALDHDAAALEAQEKALRTAEEALHLVQANYAAGLATYLDVLTADTQYYQAKISDLETIALRYQDTVALFAALGGGWWNVGRPEAAAAAPKAD
jgi:NodT family efflux transporter outer membrane factor (OMF) lipoprotein